MIKFLSTLFTKMTVAVSSIMLLAGPTFSADTPLNHEAVTFWSAGARMQGDVFKPSGLTPEQKLPGILLIHGWGGNKTNLNRMYAPQFAELGFVVMTFDLRSWGQSDGGYAEGLKLAQQWFVEHLK
jgi:uncharacterized protein